MGELSGIAIGVTAERRADDFITALERYGADVRHAPTITIVPLATDPSLRAGTEAVLAEPVAFTVVTTGAGFRGWLSAAEDWGLRDRLVTELEHSRIYARGPKAVGAIRGAGLRESFSAASESNAELFGALAAAGVDGARVAVQLHGTPLPEHTDPLVRAGAAVVQVQPYRWHSPPDVTPVHELIDAVLAGELDALAFTSAPAAANFLTLARSYGRHDELLAALRGRTVVACVGPVTAAPLEEAGIGTVQPDRQRLGALVKLLVTKLGKG
ncbi:uroporphyrinogen-III synthase [Amycolatopsis vancoresmycina]|uniref:Bifunctional uroporphyrinogen-III synthetase/response regulator domain protein n=1 Tax=Amycolatopsis vancoresmycina DSM 44592 TaxID=1292037 RepID=R1HW93_9PSEU|nr:uroporphyrinogen-III synthase [Amycolatopsis vancoresmycina]EOD64606.1 bifunctional uroporphyrinogen-III synthetase/response regulator domain protein [Amycolatopsis vancoresmycina DSM 44592]